VEDDDVIGRENILSWPIPSVVVRFCGAVLKKSADGM